MIYTKLPSPGMSWKVLNWTMWLHFHTVGKSCIWTICTAMSRLWRHWFEILVAHEKTSMQTQILQMQGIDQCQQRLALTSACIYQFWSWREPTLLQSRRIQWCNIFKPSLPPGRKWTKYRKYHTPYGCGTHPHSRDRIAKSAVFFFWEFFYPPKSVGKHHELWLSLATK